MSATVRDVMTPWTNTGREETVLDIARTMTNTGQAAVLVADTAGMLKGILMASDIVNSLGRGDDPVVTRAAQIAADTPTIEPGATLEEARELVLEQRGVAAVVDHGTPVGVIELWQLDKYMEALKALGPSGTRLITEVSPKDHASQRWRGANLLAGVSAIKCIRHAMTAARKDTVRNILDFPSGYGRILRVLKATFPDALLAAGDIDRDAVDFCARVFDATPIYSQGRPENVRINDTFDLIWCGSLLTHINSDRWPGFLSLFSKSLSPRGILVFTVHGHQLRAKPVLRGFRLPDNEIEKILQDYDRDGFGYGDYPFQNNYGISLASSGWVRQQLQEAGFRVVSYMERGWYAPAPRQDAVACILA